MNSSFYDLRKFDKKKLKKSKSCLDLVSDQLKVTDQNLPANKVGRVFPMVISLLPHMEFGANDHREDAAVFND